MPRKDPHKFRKLTFLILTQILLTTCCSHYPPIESHSASQDFMSTSCSYTGWHSHLHTVPFITSYQTQDFLPLLLFHSVFLNTMLSSSHPHRNQVRVSVLIHHQVHHWICLELLSNKGIALSSWTPYPSPLLSHQASHSTHHINYYYRYLCCLITSLRS